MAKENNKKKDSLDGKKYVYRSSITGQYVKKTYADSHPKTTVEETIVIKTGQNKGSQPKDGTHGVVRRYKK